MMYIFLSIILLSASYTTVYAVNPSTEKQPQATTAENPSGHNASSTKITLPTEAELSLDGYDKNSDAVESKVILPMETELSLKKLAMIYKKLLHDQDAVHREHFEDKNLATEVSRVIEERLNTVRSILEHEAPELAAEVEEEYAKPERMLIIYSGVAVAVIGIGILALFSYDSNTKTWGRPRLINATTSLTSAKNAFVDIFTSDDQPETGA